MARFAWQRLMGTAGFVQWKLLTVSGFVRRKPPRERGVARFAQRESLPPRRSGEIRPVEIAEHVEICPAGAPEREGVARSARHA